MDGKIIQEPAQVQSGVTPTNYCTRTATFGSTVGGQGTAGMYCPFYPRFVMLKHDNIIFMGMEGFLIRLGGTNSTSYTYTDNYLRVPAGGVQSSTRYTLTAFG